MKAWRNSTSRRIVAMAAVLAVLFSLAAIPVSAFEDVRVLFDFGQGSVPSGVRTATNLALSYENAYGGAFSSLKWSVSTHRFRMTFSGNEGKGWEDYNDLHIRFYTTAAGSQYSLIVADTPSYGSYFKPENHTVLNAGWQTLTLPLSRITANSAAANLLANGVGVLEVICDGFGMTPAAGAQMFFDSVWLSKSAAYAAVPPAAGGSGDAVSVIADYKDSAAVAGIANNPNSNNAFTLIEPSVTGSRPGGNTMYAGFTARKADAANRLDNATMKARGSLSISPEDYPYVNVWMYSPFASNTGVLVTLLPTGTGERYLPVFLDWEGWKLISAPYTSLLGAAAADVVGGAMVYANAIRANNAEVEKPFYAGNRAPLFYSAGSFGIEKIWMSKQVPSEAAPPALTGGISVPLPAGDRLVAQYATAQDIAAAGANLTANVWNKNINAMSGRTPVWGGAGYNTTTNAWVSATSHPSTNPATLFSAGNDPEKKISVGGYNYINIWLYNPTVKTDVYGNFSSFYLLLNTGTAENPFADRHRQVEIIANWSGWKLVSVPLSAFGTLGHADSSLSYGISMIRFAPNSWPRSGGTPQERSRVFTQEELDQGYSVANGTNTWADIGNYLDIDRVWLSVEKPAAVFDGGQTSTPSANVGLTDRRHIISLPRAMAEGSRAMVREDLTVAVDGVKQSLNTAYTVSFINDGREIAVEFSSNLQPQAAYAIALPEGMRDIHGNCYSGKREFSFTTAPYTLTEISVNPDGTASVSAVGTLPAGTVLFLAEYSNGALRQVNMCVSAGAAGDLTARLKEALAAGAEVKAFLLDSQNSLRPLGDYRFYEP